MDGIVVLRGLRYKCLPWSESGVKIEYRWTRPANLRSVSRHGARLICALLELMDKVRRNRPGDDVDLLRRAYDFAAENHKTQTRLSGEPYLSHPLKWRISWRT